MVERIRSKKFKREQLKRAKSKRVAKMLHPKQVRYDPNKRHRAGPGRPKGGSNMQTRILKEAILLAAEACGSDNKGKDALFGFCYKVALDDYKLFTKSLLSRVIPLQVVGRDVEAREVLKIPPERLEGYTVEELAVLERVLGKLLPPAEQQQIGYDDGNGIVIDGAAEYEELVGMRIKYPLGWMQEQCDELDAMFIKARAQGLWFFHQGLNGIFCFSPDELQAEQENGKFIWSVVNWKLIDPEEYLCAGCERARAALLSATLDYDKWLTRLEKWNEGKGSDAA